MSSVFCFFSCERADSGAPDDLCPISFAGASVEAQSANIGGNGSKKAPARQNASESADASGLEGCTSFRVWGYKNMRVNDNTYSDPQQVFLAYEVNWAEGSDNSSESNSYGWEYVGINNSYGGSTTFSQSIKYWDYSAQAYRYFAYAPADAANVTTNNAADKMTVHVSGLDPVSAKNVYLSKLCFYQNEHVLDSKYGFGKAVKLEFFHPMSEVRFIFMNQEGGLYDNSQSHRLDTTTIQFGPTAEDANIYTRGDITVSYPLSGAATGYDFVSSTPDNTAGVWSNLTVPYSEDVKMGLVNANNLNKWYTVLPVKDQGSYTLQVTIGSKPKTAVVPDAYMQWKPGFSYTYIFKIMEDGSVSFDEVQVGIKNWTETKVDHPVYNW